MNIITYPNPILETVCEQIDNISDYNEILQEMQSYVEDPKTNAAGLAMPQVGITKRAFVAKINGKTEIFINPRITKKSKSMISLSNGEGCLSIPDFSGIVPRHQKIQIVYTDINGNRIPTTLSDVDAIVFQHEFDHIEGILFIYKMKRKVEKEVV